MNQAKSLFFVVFFSFGFHCCSYSVDIQKSIVIDSIKKIGALFGVDATEGTSADIKTMTLRELLQKIPHIKDIKLPKIASKFLDGIVYSAPTLNVTDQMADLRFRRLSFWGQKKTTESRVYIGPDKHGKGLGLTLGFGLSGKFSLTDILPDIKGASKKITLGMLPKNIAKKLDDAGLTIDKLIGITDWLEFENVGIILCFDKYFEDPVWGFLKRGINFVATTKLGGPLEKLSNIFGRDLTTTKFRGLIAPTENLAGSQIQVTLKGTFPLLKIPGILEIRTGERTIVLSLVELSPGIVGPSLYGKIGLKVKLPGQKKFVNMDGFADIYLTKAVIGGQAIGMVENVFGIPGFDIGNLGLSGTISYAALVASAGAIPITGGALTGQVEIGSKKLKLLASLAVAPPEAPDIVFEGSAEGGFSKSDIVDFALKVAERGARKKGLPFNLKKLRKIFNAVVPPFKIGDHRIYFNYKTTYLFGKLYKKGFHLKAETHFAGLGGGLEAELSMDLLGLKAKIFYDQIRIPKKNPIIIISGAGPDKKRGTEDDGPIGSMELSLKKQEFYIDSIFEIPFLGIKESKKIQITPFGGLSVEVEHKLGGLFDSKLLVEGSPKSFESFKIEGHLKHSALNTLKKLLVTEANKIARKAQQELLDLSVDVEELSGKTQVAIDAWIEKKVAQTNWHIDRLENKIKTTNQRCEAGNKKACIQKLMIPAWEIEKFGHKTHRDLTLKKIFKKGVKKGVKIVAKTAKVGIDFARVSVEVSRITSNFFGKIAQGAFTISSITYNGTLKNLITKGQGVTVHVVATILGNELDQEFQIDFTKPEQLPLQVLSAMKQLIGIKKK